ncbi:DNA polymerase III [Paramagnetospirillum magneticum]|uniref:DNA polymerase III n=1 Tax=Paramagnetospirillum magneticum (strain ATCC 700264 / AMB-1) TaxID=342108 RepID=Q2WA26_PARM1|nr:DNA polymerase III [Paramagnetospirillum magneticum]BAE49299.1 DNA polymerase III [Paramagnetospirillum magneticum AMB-1]
MCSAIPPAPPPVALPPQVSAPVVLSVVADKGAAEALAKLQAGAVLAATLTMSEGKGVVQVMTADGSSLSLRLPPGQPLPPDGAQLALQFISQNGLPAFKLLSINGRPMGLAPQPLLPPNPPDLAALLGNSGAKAGQAQNPAAPSPLAQPGPAGAPVTASPGLAAGPVGLTATVIRSGPPGAVMLPPNAATPGLDMAQPLPTALTNLAAGTLLTVRIAAMAPPGQGAVSGGQPIPTATAQPAAAPQPQTEPVSARPAIATGPAVAPPAGHASPAIAQPTMPGTAPALPAGPPVMPPAPAAPPSQTVTLPAIVVAQPAGGAAVIQSPAGTLSLDVGMPMPIGSVLRLEVIGRPLPPPPLAPAAGPPQGLSPGGWPTLDQAVDALLQSDRQAAEQLMRMIPQAGPRLAAAMSLFAGAVRSGDARQLLSEPVTRGLEKAGRRDLADKLKKEFLDLAEEATRPMGRGDWQAITLPFAHGANVDPIDLYVHRPPNEDEGGGKKGSEQRFILEVRMSVLGRIQLDGLVQKDTKRFDLIVRTAEPLPAAMCRDIAGIFAECGQMTGIKGQVSFQAGRSFVDLPPAGAPATQIVV